MPRMPEFRVSRPASLAAAVALMAGEPGAQWLAGGTDLVPNLRRGLARPPLLVDLRALPELAEIEFGAPGLVLGAGVTLARLAADERIARSYRALGEAAAVVAGPGHRAVATLGGNLCLDTRCVFYNQSAWWRAANDHCLKRGGPICHVAPQGRRCHAAYSGDLAAPLIALGAEVDLVGGNGVRRVPLARCYRDDGAAHLALGHDEIVARVHLPLPPPSQLSGYRKARVRAAMDFALVGVACVLALHDGVLQTLRIAFTGTNSHPLLLDGTQTLLGRPLDEAGLAAIGKWVLRQISPMRTTVTSSNYRRQVAVVHAQRLVRELTEAALR